MRNSCKSWIPYNSEGAVLLGGCRKCRTGSEDALIAKMVTPTCSRRMPYSSEDAETAVPARRMHKLQKWYYPLVIDCQEKTNNLISVERKKHKEHM